MTAKEKHPGRPNLSKHQVTVNVTGSDRAYINRLIIVAIAANELIESAEKSGRYHIRISRQRFYTLSKALEALRKQQ